MKPLILIFSYLFPFLSIANNWELFPLNQKSYYATPNANGYKVLIFHADSAKTNNSSIEYYFNTKNPLLKKGIMEEIADKYFGSFCNDSRPDIVKISRDSVFVKYYQYDSFTGHNFNVFETFLFLPNAQVGEKWTISEKKNLEIVCTSATEEIVFGVIDSVKIFRLEFGEEKGREIKLSKHFGFIQFYRFKGLLEGLNEKSVQLFGFEKDLTKVGYRQPQIKDYFHLKPGDVLMWCNEYNSTFPPIYIKEYMKDSILATENTSSNLFYRFNRTTKSNGTISNPEAMSTTYLVSEWETLINSQTEWISLPEKNSSHIFSTGVLNVSIENNDTVTEYSFSHDGLIYNKADSFVCCIAEESKEIVLSTKFGLKSETYNTWDSTNNLTLVGSKIDGMSEGILSFPTAINELTKASVDVFPIPASRFINIRTGNTFNRYEVFDLMGSLVSAGIMESQIISLYTLRSGAYLLKLIDSHGVIYKQKIIVN